MDALATPAKAIDIPRTISFHSKSLLAMYPLAAPMCDLVSCFPPPCRKATFGSACAAPSDGCCLGMMSVAAPRPRDEL
jgi:hypothetical protein